MEVNIQVENILEVFILIIGFQILLEIYLDLQIIFGHMKFIFQLMEKISLLMVMRWTLRAFPEII